ncbi:MAG: hypothetical protein HY558_01470 [Euryarchaeota archaeon]|nr:hypothetical protein [Euryarchaeota archaeon]
MAPIIRECPHLCRGTWCSLITTDCASVEACVYKLTRHPTEEPVATCASQIRGSRGILSLIGRRLVT